MTDFLPVDKLDFDSLKENFKVFLQTSDSIFKDYNFEGSNLNILLNLLAYNTYLNAYYLNMVGTEAFFDTATLRESVTSHAKLLNYTPRSITPSKATVNIKLNISNNAIFTTVLPKYTTFSSSTSNGVFTFSTNEDYIISRNSNNEFISPINIYEGFLVTEKFVANNTISNQRFVISNQAVDSSSIAVSVRESNTAPISHTYTKTSVLYGLNSSSNNFFVQAAQGDRYEICFGDNVFGRKPTTGNLIEVTYRVSSGSKVNGANSFTMTTNNLGYTANVTTQLVASGGVEQESVSSIKFNAPKIFQAQDRAVTKNDYKALILNEFPELKAVGVFSGGEISSAPQYGKIFISPVSQSGNPISISLTEQLKQFIQSKSLMTTRVEIIDPEFLELYVNCNVYYNLSKSNITPQAISNIVSSNIINYNAQNLTDFDKTFRYSQFIANINNAHPSIVSNETTILLAKTINPPLNQNFTTQVDFYNSIQKDDYSVSRPETNLFTLYSTELTYQNKSAFIGEDGNGKLFLYEQTNTGRNILNADVGSVLYDQGIVQIIGLNISSYSGGGLTIFAGPKRQDIKTSKNNFVKIVTNKLNITSYPIVE